MHQPGLVMIKRVEREYIDSSRCDIS